MSKLDLGIVPPAPPRYSVPFDEILSEIERRLSETPAPTDKAGRTVSVVGISYGELLTDEGFASVRRRVRQAYDSGWPFVVMDVRDGLADGSVNLTLRKFESNDDGPASVVDLGPGDSRPVYTNLSRSWFSERTKGEGISSRGAARMISGIAALAGTDEEEPFLIPQMPKDLNAHIMRDSRQAGLDALLDEIRVLPQQREGRAPCSLSRTQEDILYATHPAGWRAIDVSDGDMACVRVEDAANRRCVLVVGHNERQTRPLVRGMRHYAGGAEKVVVLLDVMTETANLTLRQCVWDRQDLDFSRFSRYRRKGFSRDLLMRTNYVPGKNDYIGLVYKKMNGGRWSEKMPAVINLGKDAWEGMKVSVYAYTLFAIVPASLPDGTGYVTPIAPESFKGFVFAVEPLKEGEEHEVMLLRVRSGRKVPHPGGLIDALLSGVPNVPEPVPETSGIAFVKRAGSPSDGD